MDFSQFDLEGLLCLIENNGIPSEFINDAIDHMMALTVLPEVCFNYFYNSSKGFKH